MSARLRREGIRHHQTAVKRLLGCVLRTHVNSHAPPAETADVHPDALALALHDGAPVILRGATPLVFDFSQQFRIVAVDAPRRVRAEVIGYVYAFLTRERVELISYHWHPHGEDAVEFPHVHIGPAMSRHDSAVRPGEAHKIHLPTGPVALVDVLRLAITELEVEPRRDDWETILTRER